MPTMSVSTTASRIGCRAISIDFAPRDVEGARDHRRTTCS
jgi:hypothetical protein